jgi:hypothetical protein
LRSRGAGGETYGVVPERMKDGLTRMTLPRPVMQKRDVMKKYILSLVLASLFLVWAELVYANVPIGAAAFLAYPTVSYFTSVAVALAIALIIESLIIWIFTKFRPMEVISAVLSANVASSIFGVVTVLSFSSSLLFLIMLLPMAYALGRMFKSLCEETDIFHKARKFYFIFLIFFLITCLVFGVLLLPATDIHMHKIEGALSLNAIAAFSAIMILLGFVMTNLIEAYVVNKMLSGKRKGAQRLIVKAALTMNLCSYLVLSAVYGKAIFQFVLRAA